VEQIKIFDIMTKSKKPKLTSVIDKSNGMTWCAYCATPVKFIKDKEKGVKVCSICGISLNDYWNKTINRINI